MGHAEKSLRTTSATAGGLCSWQPELTATRWQQLFLRSYGHSIVLFTLKCNTTSSMHEKPTLPTALFDSFFSLWMRTYMLSHIIIDADQSSWFPFFQNLFLSAATYMQYKTPGPSAVSLSAVAHNRWQIQFSVQWEFWLSLRTKQSRTIYLSNQCCDIMGHEVEIGTRDLYCIISQFLVFFAWLNPVVAT